MFMTREERSAAIPMISSRTIYGSASPLKGYELLSTLVIPKHLFVWLCTKSWGEYMPGGDRTGPYGTLRNCRFIGRPLGFGRGRGGGRGRGRWRRRF